MLEFFRRYQRAFFVVITVVIVISFSFFGTFQAFSGGGHEDKVAFTAIDGSKVLRSEVNDMVNFLATDLHDHLFARALWGGNGLNDGVIANDILGSGLAEVIAIPYLSKLSKEQQPRLDREKRYTPYVHPKAAFLTADQIWTYYAPDLKTNFDALRSSQNASDPAAFSSRVQLYVAERSFPPAYLKQLLTHQESFHKWLPHDATLADRDLSLFGYHSVQDWFGRDFLELVAQFIINASKMAEQKGYSISKEEALGSLFRNAETSFKESLAKSYVGIATPAEFFQEQLRRLGMDQYRVLKTWSSVMLFRQLFFDNIDSILVDQAAYKDFYHNLNKFVDIDLYQLPEEFRFASMKDAQQFVLYLKAVKTAQDQPLQSGDLTLPKRFASPKEVKKVYPELVERKFQVRFAGINKELLQTKIGVKNTWEWQVADANWKMLQQKFPELSKGKSDTADERLQLLDKLHPLARTPIDSFSRMQIVDEHPEWIKEALDALPTQEETILLREQGGKVPFDGITNAVELIQRLDSVPLNEQSEALRAYSQDQVFYYRIEVVDRSPSEEILTFQKAKEDGTMDMLLDKVLESAYGRIRAHDPVHFLKENGEWKPLSEVKEQVASSYFQPLNHFIEKQVAIAKESNKKKEYAQQIKDLDSEKVQIAMVLRPYVTEVLTTLNEQPDQAAMLVVDEQKEEGQPTGTQQWKLMKARKRIIKLDKQYPVDPELAFSLEPQNSSSVVSYEDSGPCFFTVVAKGFLPSSSFVREKVLDERDLLGREALANLAQIILVQMQQDKAFDLGEEEAAPPKKELEEAAK